ncbi:MAG: hypothetical protein AMS27_18010 [Bacteroides sp. SM23_62_1]|nr:MAG: hypothetical protein AMS27_18010 [Bacteroides sp. SM23_62_1]
MDKIIHVWGGVIYYEKSPLLVDQDGNIYLTGFFHDTVFFESENNFLVTVDSSDSFLAKVYPDGTLAWKKAVSGFAHEYILDIEVDQEGFIYFIGDFGGTLMIDTAYIEAAGYNDAYLCKMDPDGRLIKLISDEELHFFKMAMDGNGQMYLIGLAKGNQLFNFAFETSGHDSQGYGAFTAKLNSSFNADWVISICDSANLNQPAGSFNRAVITDSFNNAYISGRVNDDTIQYLSKFDPDGNMLWFKSLTPADSVDIADLFVDKFDNLYAVAGGSISKFNNDGDKLWRKEISYRFWTYAVDQNGYTYLIYFENWGSLDGFMIVDPNGYIVYDYSFDKIEFHQLAMDADGNVYLNGLFADEISVEGKPLNPKRGENFIMMKLKSEEMIGGLYYDGTNQERNFSLYPNPAIDILNIETNISNLHCIEITSLNGQLLYNTKTEDHTFQIDLSSFQKGIYFITVRSRDYVITEKIIKL